MLQDLNAIIVSCVPVALDLGRSCDCRLTHIRWPTHIQVKRKKADSARKELAAQRGAGGARVEDGTSQPPRKPKAVGGEAAAKLRNPKAFVFSGRGKAKKQASRTAERDQRRLHGRRPYIYRDLYTARLV